MKREQYKKAGIGSSNGNYRYDQIVLEDHFLRTLLQLSDWDKHQLTGESTPDL